MTLAANVIRQLTDGFARVIDCVAGAVVAARMRWGTTRTIHLIEEQDGAFAVGVPGESAETDGNVERIAIVEGDVAIVDGDAVGELPPALATKLKASDVELRLQSSRFVFRPLELPARASEFLDGVVRTQIDRLTPWAPADAAFGWTRPREIGADRILVTIGATARDMVAPIVEAVARLGPSSIAVSTLAEGFEADDGVINVFEQRIKGALDLAQARRALIAVLAVAAGVAALSVIADMTLGSHLESRRIDVARRIALWRTSTLAGQESVRDSARVALERRKRETPLSVIVLEALSQVLPDHTYLTELRIIGDKMQAIGVTGDAPSLIRLIEQSSQFTRATFFAPTTRSPSEPGEHFHIEAHLESANLARK